ncbi:MAG: DUF1573 domain-containing protein [Bacteroidetes bacterium]|nr:DUF1573 domain-containing protein [Bacteroidota bacterium]
MSDKIKLFATGFLLLISTIACKQNSNERLSADLVNNPNSASGKQDTSGLPKFQFESDIHDFGKVIEGEKLSYSFKFKNIGNSDLIISTAQASCGCTVPEFPKDPIHKGEAGVITVTFNTAGKNGFQHKTVTLGANTQPSDFVLHIKAMVSSPEK